MITHRSMLRFSFQSGLFDRAIRVFGPRSEPSITSNQPFKSLFQSVHDVRGLEGSKGSTYLHSNSEAVPNLNVVPQLLGNLCKKVNSSVCPLFAVSLRRSIHSSSQKEFETTERNTRSINFGRNESETTERNTRSMNFVRGIIEGDRGNIQFPQYGVEHNSDIVHIKMLRNNTFVTVTDAKGNRKFGASSGMLSEMKKGPKLSRYAAEATAEHVGRLARNMGLKTFVMKVNGFTHFKKKKQAILSFRDGYTHSRGDQNPIVYIEDTTRKAHNGCRLRKKRRV